MSVGQVIGILTRVNLRDQLLQHLLGCELSVDLDEAVLDEPLLKVPHKLFALGHPLHGDVVWWLVTLPARFAYPFRFSSRAEHVRISPADTTTSGLSRIEPLQKVVDP